MSYDLFFRSKPGVSPLTLAAFTSYFQGRPHYELQNGKHAFYSNDDTGVYFSFDYSAEESSVAFNLNYFRPHPFGLEAEPEVAAFIARFPMAMNDPQNEGMNEGPYSALGFLRGWNAGNRFAHTAIISQMVAGKQALDFATLPARELDRCWKWNYDRWREQERLGEQVFVPKIMFLDGPRTVIVWGEDVTEIFLPRVDEIVVIRERLAPPGAVGAGKVGHIPWSVIEPLVHGARKHGEGAYLEWSPEIEAMFRNAVAPAKKPAAIGFDKILGRELVASASQPR